MWQCFEQAVLYPLPGSAETAHFTNTGMEGLLGSTVYDTMWRGGRGHSLEVVDLKGLGCTTPRLG